MAWLTLATEVMEECKLPDRGMRDAEFDTSRRPCNEPRDSIMAIFRAKGFRW